MESMKVIVLAAILCSLPVAAQVKTHCTAIANTVDCTTVEQPAVQRIESAEKLAAREGYPGLTAKQCHEEAIRIASDMHLTVNDAAHSSNQMDACIILFDSKEFYASQLLLQQIFIRDLMRQVQELSTQAPRVSRNSEPRATPRR